MRIYTLVSKHPALLSLVPFLVAIGIHCSPRPVSIKPLTHSVYVWQRVWTSELTKTITESQSLFASAHILAFQVEPSGKIIRINFDHSFLRDKSIPLVATIRISDNSPPEIWNSLPEICSSLMRKDQPAWSGIEIDWDCPTAKLDVYAARLTDLRRIIPKSMTLSITALPTWTSSARLSDLAETVDYSVLQLHSVSVPTANHFFDPGLAFRQIAAYAKRSGKPFYAALPAYSSRLYSDRQGVPAGIENESPREDLRGMSFRELSVDPAAVASCISRVASSGIRNLEGFIWFRLPLASDNRSWSLAALRAVIRNEPLKPVLVLTQENDEGVIDLSLANRGTCDAPLPTITVRGDVRFAEAFPLYVTDHSAGGLRFKPVSPRALPPGCRCVIGWVRGDSITTAILATENKINLLSTTHGVTREE
jgi:hypothetical protein